VTTVDKLSAVREVKSKSVVLKAAKHSVQAEINHIVKEAELITNLKEERDLLAKEKERKMEELRQVNADINTIDALLKSASDAEAMHKEAAELQLVKFSNLKRHVDGLRVNVLQIPPTQDLTNQQLDQLAAFGITSDGAVPP